MFTDYVTYCIYGLLTGVVLTIVCFLYGFQVTMSTVQFMDAVFRRRARGWNRKVRRQAMNLKRESLEGITRQTRSVPPLRLSTECTLFNYKRRSDRHTTIHRGGTQEIEEESGGGSVAKPSERRRNEGKTKPMQNRRPSDGVLEGGVGEPFPMKSSGVTAGAVSSACMLPPLGTPRPTQHQACTFPAVIPVLSAMESETPQEGPVGAAIPCKIVLVEGEIHVYEILSSTRGLLGGSGGVTPWGGAGGIGGGSGGSSTAHHPVSYGATAEHFRGRIPLSVVKVEHYKPQGSRQRRAQTFFNPSSSRDCDPASDGAEVENGVGNNSFRAIVSSSTALSSSDSRSDTASERALLLFSRGGEPLFINSRFGNPVTSRSSSERRTAVSRSTSASSSKEHRMQVSASNGGMEKDGVGSCSGGSVGKGRAVGRPGPLLPLQRSASVGSASPSSVHEVPLSSRMMNDGKTSKFIELEEVYHNMDILRSRSNDPGGGVGGVDLLSWNALVLEFSDPRQAEMWYTVLKNLDEVESWREYLRNIPISDTLNTFLGRLLFPSFRQKGLERMITRMIREKLVEVTARKFPRFLTGGIHLDDFVLGASIPWVSEVSKPAMSTHGEIGFDLNILYKGEGSGFVLFFRFALSYRGIRIPRFILSIKLLELQASLHISIGPPPSKKIWVGLHRPPILRIQANQGCASGKGLLHRFLTSLPDMSGIVCNLLRLYLFSEMILPEMDDFPLPSIEETTETLPATESKKPAKGNYFDHARAAEKSRRIHTDYQAFSASTSTRMKSEKNNKRSKRR